MCVRVALWGRSGKGCKCLRGNGICVTWHTSSVAHAAGRRPWVVDLVTERATALFDTLPLLVTVSPARKWCSDRT